MHASCKTNFDMMQPCGHLLGMALLYVMFSCVIVIFPISCPWSGVVFDCIYSLFLPSFLLLPYAYVCKVLSKYEL